MKTRIHHFALSSLMVCSMSPSIQAASETWKIVATNGNWHDVNNWIGGAIPNGSADAVTFNSTSNFSTISIGSTATTVDKFTFSPGAAAFTLTGSYDLAEAHVTGVQTVNFNSGILNLLFQTGFNTTGALKIFDFDAYAGSGFTSVNVSGLADGYEASFDSSNGMVTVVPEPSALSWVCCMAGAAVLRRRRN
jgi:hypothetical protein